MRVHCTAVLTITKQAQLIVGYSNMWIANNSYSRAMVIYNIESFHWVASGWVREGQ